MATPTPLLTDDPAANRRVWAEQLRRPDWRIVPLSDDPDDVPDCENPWEVALAWWSNISPVRFRNARGGRHAH